MVKTNEFRDWLTKIRMDAVDYSTMLLDELLMHVFGYIYATKRAQCREVCSRWRYLLDTIPERGQQARSWWNHPLEFIDYCQNGELRTNIGLVCLESLMWMHSRFVITRDEIAGDSSCVMSYWGAHLESAVWITNTFTVAASYITAEAFRETCRGGHLLTARWMRSRFAISRSIVIGDYHAFHEACTNGKLDVARWLANTFAITGKEARQRGGWAFRIACVCGHLPIARWMWGTFGVTRKEAILDDTFRSICGMGHLMVAQWLVKTFRITRQEVVEDNRSAFHMACGKGHLLIAQWLAETFEITRQEAITSNHYYALRYACTRGYLDVAKWLTMQFGVTNEQIRMVRDHTFGDVCTGGHLLTAQWLAEQYAVTRSDVTGHINGNIVWIVCKSGHFAVASWLVKEFRITKDMALDGAPLWFCEDEPGPVSNWVAEVFGRG
jgi:uncharacterized protein YacL (UPF0231 family)